MKAVCEPERKLASSWIMAGTAFITPATADKWDDTKRASFVEHVAAKVAAPLEIRTLPPRASCPLHDNARVVCRTMPNRHARHSPKLLSAYYWQRTVLSPAAACRWLEEQRKQRGAGVQHCDDSTVRHRAGGQSRKTTDI